jgi:hypothetical protein
LTWAEPVAFPASQQHAGQELLTINYVALCSLLFVHLSISIL